MKKVHGYLFVLFYSTPFHIIKGLSITYNSGEFTRYQMVHIMTTKLFHFTNSCFRSKRNSKYYFDVLIFCFRYPCFRFVFLCDSKWQFPDLKSFVDLTSKQISLCFVNKASFLCFACKDSFLGVYFKGSAYLNIDMNLTNILLFEKLRRSEISRVISFK